MITIDACTAILLAKASVLETFVKTHEASMTKHTFEEVMRGEANMYADALLVKRLESEKKLGFVAPNQSLVKKLMKDFNMAEGEASTIAVAIKAKCIVATDNRQGRKAAAVNNLPLTGSPEIVVSLFKKDKIGKEKAAAAVKILKKEGWFDAYLIEKAMEDLK